MRAHGSPARLVGAVLVLACWGCGFEGLSQSESGGVRPPDTQIAAGHTQIMEAVNLRLRIIPRSGGSAVDRSIFDIIHPGCNTTGGAISDPRLHYDTFSSRFFFVVLHAPAGTSTPGAWCLSVSATSDALGTWYRYRIAMPNAPNSSGTLVPAFPDYPGLGVGEDKVVLTGNPASGGFLLYAAHSTIAALNKSQVLAGVTVSVNYFTGPYDTSKLFLLQPANVLDATSTGNVHSFGVNAAAANPSTLRRYRVSGIPPSSTVQMTAISFTGNWKAPLFARQPDSATNGYLDALDGRVLHAVFRDGKITLVACVACDNSTRTCIRVVRLDGATITAFYNFGNQAKDYFFPAVTVDAALNQLIVFNASSDSEPASVYITGRRPTDPPQTLRTPRLVKAGIGSYWDGRCSRPCNCIFGNCNRWGDYSGVAVDAANQLDSWAAAEYPIGLNTWGTWIEFLNHNNFPQ